MIDGRQSDLFAAGAAPRAGLELAEALDNARRVPLRVEGAGADAPPGAGAPALFALCPGCRTHPDGGLVATTTAEAAADCPAATRLAAQLTVLAGGEERRWAEREGSAHTGSVERETLARPSPPATFHPGAGASHWIDFSLTVLGRLCSGAVEAVSAILVAPPRRLWADGGRRLRRRWYFHRRQAVCRQRLSRIANDPSWIS